MELKGFLQVLFNRRWLLLSVVSVAMIATYLIASQAPPRYKARVRIVAGLTNGSNSLFSLGQDGSAERYEVEARFRHLEEMIRSPKVLAMVGYELMRHDLSASSPFRNLDDLRQTFSNDEVRVALRNYATKRDSLALLQASDELERKHLDMMEMLGYDPEALRQGLDVRRVPGTDYIALEYGSEQAELSAFVVNQLAREFIRFYLLTNSRMAENALTNLEELVDERKTILDEKLSTWTRYQQQQSLSTSSLGLEVLGQMEKLEKAREEAEGQLLAAERRLVEARQAVPNLRGEEPFASASSVSEAGLLRSRLLRLNDQYVRTGLQQASLLDSIGAVRQLLINALSAAEQIRMGEEAAEFTEAIAQWKASEVDLFIQQTRLTAIAQELRRLGAQAGTVSDPQLASTVYGRDVELARDAYLSAIRRLNDARLGIRADGQDLGAVSQMEFAQAPDKPEPSQAFLLAALAGLISLGFALGVLLLLEYLDNSIKLPSRFTNMTGLPLMGSLLRLRSSNLDLVALFHETQKNTQLEAYKQQLRILRHEIMQADPVTLMVTSTRTGAGKSSLLVSLAYSISLSGKRVLMIDTNLGNASLTAMTSASPTLQKYLQGQLPMDALVSPSVFDNVDVIGCAVSQASPTEAFPHQPFEQLLVKLSDNYDHILLEGAALNDFVDARELLMYSARILPVFAADAPVEEADKKSIAYLRQFQEKLMGAVLNKVEMRHLVQ